MKLKRVAKLPVPRHATRWSKSKQHANVRSGPLSTRNEALGGWSCGAALASD
jgi:hypothetical protein